LKFKPDFKSSIKDVLALDIDSRLVESFIDALFGVILPFFSYGGSLEEGTERSEEIYPRKPGDPF